MADTLGEVKVLVGLRAQGKYETVEQMRQQFAPWEDIGRVIGWEANAVRDWYELESRAELSRLRLALADMTTERDDWKQLTNLVQAGLETWKSDAPNAEAALLDRVRYFKAAEAALGARERELAKKRDRDEWEALENAGVCAECKCPKPCRNDKCQRFWFDFGYSTGYHDGANHLERHGHAFVVEKMERGDYDNGMDE